MPITRQDKRIAVASIKQLPSVLKKNIMDDFVEQSNITLFIKSIALMIKMRSIHTDKTYRLLFLRFNMNIIINRENISLSVSIMNGPTISFSNVWFQNHGYTPERIFSVINYLVDHHGPVQLISSENLQTFMKRHRSHILSLQSVFWDQKAVIRKSIKDDAIIRTIDFILKI